MSLRDTLWGGIGCAAGRTLSTLGVDSRLTVLIFHSVGPRPDPLGHWDVTEELFELRMRALRRAFNVISLKDGVQHLQQGTLPARAACITFDDGYADNFTVALPVLQRHELTATFFVATHYLDGGRMFNDVVIESVRDTDMRSLDLSALDLGVHDLSSVPARVTAIGNILQKIKSLALQSRDEVAQAIAQKAGITLKSQLMMSKHQVAGLAAAGMDIGAHTRRHPILASMSDDEAMQEMLNGKTELETIVAQPVTLFAYPNGRPDLDYDRRHVAMAKEIGFAAAVTTADGAATYGADPFQLPRFTPWDPSPEKFIARLMLNWRTNYDVAK